MLIKNAETMINQVLKQVPAPVARYFDHVLAAKQKRISRVYLKHSGYFRPSANSKWLKIKGSQYFSATEPGFRWTGRTFWFRAIDQFKDGRGSLRVWLLSIIPIVNDSGYHVDHAELMRWLAESVWFPTSLLPSEQLKWEAVDANKSRLSLTSNGLNIYLMVSFNEKGEITRMETERYKEKDRLEKWTGIVSDYKEIEGMKIPNHIEAVWSLDSGDFKYADFYVDKIEYKYCT